MLRRNECRLNFKNRPVRTGDIKGGPKQPPLPLIGVARSLPLIGLNYTIGIHVCLVQNPLREYDGTISFFCRSISAFSIPDICF